MSETRCPPPLDPAQAGDTSEPDIEPFLRLVLAGGRAGPRRTLLERAGSPAAALAQGDAAWRAAGLDENQRAALRRPDEEAMAASLRWIAQPGRTVIGWHDPEYPALLRRTASPPLALFVHGDPALLWQPAVAVVGSRSPTPAGRDNTVGFVRALVQAGMTVASGLAAGIDTVAHATALAASGPTYAVLGTGPDIAYPRGNGALQDGIAAAGALVSEHPPGTGPRKEHFPSRNRILAGLTLGTLVVEAAGRSGALITARLAAESGREVFAVPGSIHNPLVRGCHRLIRDGATLVEDIEQVLAGLAPVAQTLASALRDRLTVPTTGGGPIAPGRPPPATSATTRAATTPTPPGLSSYCDRPDHQRLWSSLGPDPSSMDQLVQRSGLTAADVSSILLHMELEGRVAAQHGRYFRRG